MKKADYFQSAFFLKKIKGDNIWQTRHQIALAATVLASVLPIATVVALCHARLDVMILAKTTAETHARMVAQATVKTPAPITATMTIINADIRRTRRTYDRGIKKFRRP
jgi:hypothetical protein